MLLELIAAICLQAQGLFEKTHTITSTYYVEVKVYNPELLFTLNFILDESVEYLVRDELTHNVRYKIEDVAVRPSFKDAGHVSLLLSTMGLSGGEYRLISQHDDLLAGLILRSAPIGPPSQYQVGRFTSTLPKEITLFAQKFKLVNSDIKPSRPSQQNRIRASFSLIEESGAGSISHITLDRQWDDLGRTIFADISILGGGNSRATLRMQRVPPDRRK